ncbi:hypothetical protein EON83_28135 [bacterium]|nr:MAG: hypothetical protein EON83_28135 [bacterium]
MTAGILQWLLFGLAYASFGLVVGGSVYFVFRMAESWGRDEAMVFNIFIALAIVAGITSVGSPLFRLIFLPIMVVVLCSFKFHQKSGGVSQSAIQAFLLMMAATLVALSGEFYILMRLERELPSFYAKKFFTSPSVYFGFFLLLISVPVIPFLLWAYQSVRPRPGIDRHLKLGE